MELRIRDKNSKIHTITTLNEQASFKELKEEISKLTGVLLPYQERMLKKNYIFIFPKALLFYLFIFIKQSKNRISAKNM